jgi:hypothetical protein
MLILLMLLAVADKAVADKPDLDGVRSQIQGLYEDIRQMRAQSTTSADVDALQAVRYTPDWTFVDKSGQAHTWEEVRQQHIDALAHQSRDAWYQPIQKLTLSGDGSTATILITEQGVRYEDSWVKAGDSWKMKTRRQLE